MDHLNSHRSTNEAAGAVGAKLQFDNWLKANRYKLLEDRQGSRWSLVLESDISPDEDDFKKPRWTIKLSLTLRVDSSELVSTGVLDSQRDDRTIQLMSSSVIPMVMVRPEYYCSSVEEARAYIADEIGRVKDSLSDEKIHDIKRSLIFKWIDNRKVFGP